MSAAPDRMDIVVCGAHLDGQPLNWQMVNGPDHATQPGMAGTLVETTKTAEVARMFFM